MKAQGSRILAGLFVMLSVTGVAYGERYIVVNGTRLNLAQIQQLERFHCGPIPNGHYWLNPNTGIWGYAGGPPQGHISDNCYNPGRRPSLSERGMLFSPRDWLK
jgi:hypothetical protein